MPLCFWLSLATALLSVAAWRTISILASPLNNAVRHRPNGKLITWNRFASLSSLLVVTVLVSAIATIGIFGFAMNRTSFYSVYSQSERPFVLLVTSSVVIILLLFVWLVRIRPLQKLVQRRFAAVVILAIPVAIYLALNSWLPPLLDPPSDYTGPFASWPAMVQFARHEADRIDKDALVYDVAVFTYPVHGPYSPQTVLFSVTFMFVRPNGEGINIELLDTNPIRLEFVESPVEALVTTPASTDARKQVADGLAYIKLGPQDVYNLTENDAIAFAQRNGINVAEFRPSLEMPLWLNPSYQFGVPAVWQMYYISLGIAKNGYGSLDLYVDGATGRVLDRHSLPSESTATPTPQPLATASPSP